MATEPLIEWLAPEHYHTEKKPDWYWSVGIITLSVTAVTFIFGNVISGIFVLVATAAMVIHVSKPAKALSVEINDRGIMVEGILYPFVSLESFWIPHDEYPHKLIIKSRRLLMPLIVIYIDDTDPEDVREILLKYIAETEHHEPFLKHILERFGF
jgi:lipid-A-disaccharide synthase-like uncharacterized protein